MSQDIHSQIDSLDGTSVDYTDPNLYTKILGYDQEGAADHGAGAADTAASSGQGDTAAAAAHIQADGTPAAGQTDNTSQAGAAASADSGAAPDTAGQADATLSQAIEGIATVDGKRTIPYAVLQQERRANAQLKEQVRLMQQQLQEKAASASNSQGDLADRAAQDPDSLTDAELEQLEQDFPSLAKPLKLLRKLVEDRGAQAPAAQATAAPAPAPAAPAAGKASTPEDEQAAYDEGIADNPLIAKWMSEGGREWQRACAIDQVLMSDPANADLTYTERFAKVQRMVAAEFGLSLPAAPAPAPSAPASAAAAAAAPNAAPPSQSVMPTLTDLSGTGVSVSKDPLSGMTAGQMVDAAMDMSEEQLRRMAGLSY